MARWHWVRICMLIAAAVVSWPLSVGADTGHVVVVIVPSFRPESPPSSEVPSAAISTMGAAASNGPDARAAASDGSLLRWR